MWKKKLLDVGMMSGLVGARKDCLSGGRGACVRERGAVSEIVYSWPSKGLWSGQSVSWLSVCCVEAGSGQAGRSGVRGVGADRARGSGWM